MSSLPILKTGLGAFLLKPRTEFINLAFSEDSASGFSSKSFTNLFEKLTASIKDTLSSFLLSNKPRINPSIVGWCSRSQ